MNSESMRKHPKYCYSDGTTNAPQFQALVSASSPLSVPSAPPALIASSLSLPSSAVFETLPLTTPASSVVSLGVSTAKCEPPGPQDIRLPAASLPSLIKKIPSSEELKVLPALSNVPNTAQAVPLPSLLFSSSSQLQQTIAIAPPLGLPPLPTPFLTSNAVYEFLPPKTSSSTENSALSMSTALPAPLLSIPLFNRDLAMDLKEALERLGSTCAFCWMRKRPCTHGLWECSHNQVNKYATGADMRYRDFRDAIACSAYSHCYGCYIPQKSSYANNGRTTRFHPSGYGRKSCPWKDTILPISYLVFISHSLRKLFAPYDIPGINFMNPSQTDFLTWFMNTENADCLPPALFILYVIKNEFGMPPPLPQDPKPADIDPFA